MRGAATSEREQTTSHFTVVATAFERSAAQLANDRTSIPNTVSYTLSLKEKTKYLSLPFLGSVKMWPRPLIGTD